MTMNPIERVRTLHTSGGHLVTLVVPLERRRERATWVHQEEQMYEHIAYELRYRNLSAIEHDSICMKAQNLSNHSYRVVNSH